MAQSYGFSNFWVPPNFSDVNCFPMSYVFVACPGLPSTPEICERLVFPRHHAFCEFLNLLGAPEIFNCSGHVRVWFGNARQPRGRYGYCMKPARGKTNEKQGHAPGVRRTKNIKELTARRRRRCKRRCTRRCTRTSTMRGTRRYSNISPACCAQSYISDHKVLRGETIVETKIRQAKVGSSKSI